jgi:hypothetical protein
VKLLSLAVNVFTTGTHTEEICVMNADGTHIVNLANTQAGGAQVIWSIP